MHSAHVADVGERIAVEHHEIGGFPGFDVVIWYGMLAPAGTPPDLVAKLNTEVIRIFGLPSVRERWAAQDFEIATTTASNFSAYIKSELAQRYAWFFNKVVALIPPGMRLAIHLCRGNFKSTLAASGNYDPVAVALLAEMNLDAYFLVYVVDR